jgi:hypothetical protein
LAAGLENAPRREPAPWFDPQAVARMGNKASVARDAARNNAIRINFRPDRTNNLAPDRKTHTLNRIVADDF